MILKKCTMRKFSEYCGDKQIACYGIGAEFERIIKNYESYAWEDKICCLVDNSPKKKGTVAWVKDRAMTILSLEQFLTRNPSEVVVLITCTAFNEIVEQLNRIPALDQVECFIFHFMYSLSDGEFIQIRHTEEMLIPPVIHYCWFGGKELPDLYKRCIESWHKYCPGYEIKEWNETNCDIAETNYTKQAYEAGKFAFVSDYFHLKVVFDHGGICLDTDVEALKNLDDLRYNHAFCGLQSPGLANFGLGFGAEKGHEVVRSLMQCYKTIDFVKQDGSFDETPSPVYQTQDLVRLGMRPGPCAQAVKGVEIYPIEVLSPKNPLTEELCITEYSYTLHHYSGSWATGEFLERITLKKEYAKKLQTLFDKG